MKQTLIFGAALALLSGCAALQSAGRAEYTVRPYTAADGTVQCCEVHVVNGKEYALLEAHVVKQGDDWRVDLKEQGVAAFQGQAHAANVAQAAIEAAVATVLAPVAPIAPADGVGLRAPR